MLYTYHSFNEPYNDLLRNILLLLSSSIIQRKEPRLRKLKERAKGQTGSEDLNPGLSDSQVYALNTILFGLQGPVPRCPLQKTVSLLS